MKCVRREFENCISVPVWSSIYNSIYNSVYSSVRHSVRGSITSTVRNSVTVNQNQVRDGIRKSM
jgi:hypothetical protein